MNTGKYVFAQVADFIPRYEFDCIVKKYDGDYHVRDLTCYNLFLHMMFGQLTVCNSIRDICLCLKAHQRILYPLGFRQTVNVSSLSRANRDRDYRIWEELGYVLIDIVRPLYRTAPIPDVFLPGWEIFAIDSTTISCSIKLMTWVIYVMDKAYVDCEAPFRINEHNAYWITRAKNNMKYEVIDTNYNIDESTGLRGDYAIRLTGPKPKKLYPKPIRLVKYYDAENDEDLTFITNQTDISALQVADLYRNRWQIETFFKWIKGNLTIKALWGHSEKAVKTQLWTAICTYLIVARIKASAKNCPYTITEVATLLSVSALMKMDLVDLLTNPDNNLLDQNQNVNELTLF